MSLEFELQLTPPFSHELSMGVWLRHPDEQVDIIDENKYSRLFKRPEGPVILSIEHLGEVDNPSCKVSLQGEHCEASRDWAESLSLRILNGDADIKGFFDHIREADPRLFEGISFLKGLRPVQTPTLFETLVFAIVGQQVNLKFAYQCRVALENKYAFQAEINSRNWVCALEPENLLNATVEDLRTLKISGNKAKSIIRLARAFDDGEIVEARELKKLSEEEIDKKLLALFGIGPWTVEYAKIRALGFQDSLPSGDAGLRAAMENFYQLQQKLSPETIEEMAEKWKPFRSFATYYLWTWLGQNEKNKKKH